MPRFAWALLVAGGLLTLLGCGRSSFDTVDLKGQIWVDGLPAPKGSITFSPLEAGHGRGVSASVKEGTYEAKQVAIGPTRVTFVLVKETGRMMQSWGKEVPEIVEIVPPKYIPGMNIDVQSDEATKDFSLESN